MFRGISITSKKLEELREFGIVNSEFGITSGEELNSPPNLCSTESKISVGACTRFNSELRTPNSELFWSTGYTSVTPAWAFKLQTFRPNPYIWDFCEADTCVNWAKANNLRIRGNCLLWHLHIPDWIEALPADPLEVQLKNYIQAVVGGYPEVSSWDVVNELMADVGVVRESTWQRIPEVVEKAFLWAHEANPKALLFYNDYRPMAKDKWLAIFACIDNLKAKNIPIHGIGIQLHHHLRRCLAEGLWGWTSLKWVVEEARSRNLLVEFTEVSVLDDLGMPASREKVLEGLYAIAQELDVLGFTMWHWN